MIYENSAMTFSLQSMRSRNLWGELSYEDYCQNRQVKLAVERDYEIIGEALRRMQADFEADFLTIADGRKIIDFRNILAHGYDSIADEIVWSITSHDIHLLESDVEIIMKKNC